MNAVSKILNRVWALEFFKTNATFFLVVLGFTAGFMRSADHIALAESFVASPLLISIPIVVWFIYFYQVIQFNQSTLKRKENEFLHLTSLMDFSARITALFIVTFLQLIPVYLYGFFLIVQALKLHFVDTAAIVICSLVILHGMLILLMHRSLCHSDHERKIGMVKRFFDRLMIKPYPLIVIEWVARRKTIALLGFKVFSCLLLYGVSALYDKSYDARFLGMTVAIVAGLNMTLVYEVHRFDNVHFSLLRQLPITIFRKIIYTTSALAIIILPESGMIISLFTSYLSFADCLKALIFGWSSIALLYAFLYRKDRSEEQITTIAFGGVMGFFVLILFRVPMIALSIANFSAAFWMIKRYYYSFELESN